MHCDFTVLRKTLDICSMLDIETERELFIQYKEHNCLNSRTKIINHNLKFVLHIANQYSIRYGTIDDIFQEGVIGLLESLDKFDYWSNTKFSTFAAYRIKFRIVEQVKRNSHLTKTLTTKPVSKAFFNLWKYQNDRQSFTDDQLIKISKELNIPIKDIKEVEQMIEYGEFSIHLSEDDSEFDMEFPSSDSYDPLHLLLESEIPDIDMMSSILNDREKIILERRYTGEEPCTKTQIAKEFGISCERVSQLEKQMFKKIKHTYGEYL